MCAASRRVRAGASLVALVALVVAAYTALAVLYTWPLAAKLHTHLPHDLGDPLVSTWLLWWHQRVLPFTDTWWTGLAFYPADGTLALSDHRAGLALIATPVQWLGGSAITAYNVAYILSFSLSAAGAYWLLFAITRTHLESAIVGLVFGFNPFRLDHVSHLEILSSYWLPVCLIGLHVWLRTARPQWLVVAAVAYLLQALTCGYYLFYAAVLLVLWAVWFLRGDVVRVATAGAVFAAICTPLVPVLLEYRRVHEYFGLARSIRDVEALSADLTGLISGVPWLAGVQWFDALAAAGPERSIFPGLTAVGVTVAAAIAAVRRSVFPRHPASALRIACLVAAGLAGLTALSPLLFGPWQLALGPVRLSVSAAYKPFSVCVLFLVLYAVSSPATAWAWRRRSVFAFYVLATLTFWMLSFGPTPTVFGHRWLYKAPYSWLMVLPGFDTGLRAPSRFAMVASLCLAVAAGLALRRLIGEYDRRKRAWIVAVLAILVFEESRPRSFPVVEVPEPLAWPAPLPPGAVVLELPLGGVEDALAVYDSVVHGRRVINGLSGYDPTHYGLLRRALEQEDAYALHGLAQLAPIGVAIRSGHAQWRRYLDGLPDSRAIGTRGNVDFYFLPQLPRVDNPVGSALPVREILAGVAPDSTALMKDGNLATSWSSIASQTGNEFITIDLLAASPVCEIRLSQGRNPGVPEMLAIDADWGDGWQTVWSGRAVGRAVGAALIDPRRVETSFDLPLAAREVARLRLRQTGRNDATAWSIAELQVFGCQRRS